MPAIKKALFARSSEFNALAREAMLAGERNDCAVKAVSVACGQSYDAVLAHMNANGRRSGKGTPWSTIWAAMNHFGFVTKDVNPQTMISQYPGVHATALSNVTTHHPDRFPKVWADGKTYLLCTKGHILAVKNGVNCDWTRGTAKRVWRLLEVVKA